MGNPSSRKIRIETTTNIGDKKMSKRADNSRDIILHYS